MKLVRESIFSSAVRSFCIAFFSVIGIMIAVFLVLLVFGAGKTTKITEMSNYDLVIPESNGRKYLPTSNKPLILRLDVEGVIGSAGSPFGSNQGITIDEVRSILNESHQGPLLKNNRIKALLIYMNSPGGGVTSSESIYYAVKEYALKHQIPVYTYVEGLCASGGYMIACATDKIYASSASIIGSVGAYMMFFNVVGSMDKVGVQNWTLSRGKNKTAMSPFQPWNENSDQVYVPLINTIYQQFTSIVTSSRKSITQDQLVNDYGAAVFMADKAESLGYIDGAGYQYTEVVDMLAKEANLDDYQVISMEPKAKLTDLFKFDHFNALSSLSLFKKLAKSDEVLEPMALYETPEMTH